MIIFKKFLKKHLAFCRKRYKLGSQKQISDTFDHVGLSGEIVFLDRK